MGPLQYELFASSRVGINRMFTMFHAQFPKLEQIHIGYPTYCERSCWCIKTAAFICDCNILYWFNVPNIRHVIHISVPHTIKSA